MRNSSAWFSSTKRLEAGGNQMNNQRLQYYIHDDMDAFRLELSGSLRGEGVRSVYHAWGTALSIVGERPVIADITFVTYAGGGGPGPLHLWHRHGRRIIAGNAQASALAESYLVQRRP